MESPKHSISGDRVYCAGGWSQSLAKDLSREKITEIELLDDWKDFSCFEGGVDNIEYLKVTGTNGTISSIDNISVFKNLKKLVLVSKVKKEYDLRGLKNLELIDAAWQRSLTTVLNSGTLTKVLLSSVDDKIVDFAVENRNVDYIWLSRPKLSSLKFLKCFPGLCTLRISNSAKLDSLDGLGYCNKLEELDIENSRKLNSASEVANTPRLKKLRLMKVSPDFDVSMFIDQEFSIENICVGGPGVPELPWLDLLSNKKVSKIAGWWDPSNCSKEDLLYQIEPKREMVRFGDNGKNNKQLLVVEF